MTYKSYSPKKERIANEKKVSEINVNYPKASTFQT